MKILFALTAFVLATPFDEFLILAIVLYLRRKAVRP